jgi:GxxExxY protein
MTPINADDLSHRVRQCHEALFEEALTHKIIGGFFKVYNTLGHGFLESVYAKALESELVGRGLYVAREVPADVYYNGEVVGVFRADMVVESRVVLELKGSRKIDHTDIAQLLNYLRATDLELGLLLHFGPRASFKRLIASNAFGPARAYQRSSAVSASSAAAPFTNNAVVVPLLSPEQRVDAAGDSFDAGEDGIE